MRSLADLLSTHAPVLLLDTAGLVAHAAWLDGRTTGRWHAVEEEAGSGLFRALAALDAPVEQANAFIYCEGPGSILGIRTSAMILRTWRVLRARPVFAYRSLELLAVARGKPGQTMIADARRQLWHAVTLDAAGIPGAVQRVAADQLRAPLAMPAGFRHWSPLPDTPVERMAYDLPALWRDAAAAPLLRETAEPEAFLHEPPQYVTWSRTVHQRPASP